MVTECCSTLSLHPFEMNLEQMPYWELIILCDLARYGGWVTQGEKKVAEKRDSFLGQTFLPWNNEALCIPFRWCFM